MYALACLHCAASSMSCWNIQGKRLITALRRAIDLFVAGVLRDNPSHHQLLCSCPIQVHSPHCHRRPEWPSPTVSFCSGLLRVFLFCFFGDVLISIAKRENLKHQILCRAVPVRQRRTLGKYILLLSMFLGMAIGTNTA